MLSLFALVSTLLVTYSRPAVVPSPPLMSAVTQSWRFPPMCRTCVHCFLTTVHASVADLILLWPSCFRPTSPRAALLFSQVCVVFAALLPVRSCLLACLLMVVPFRCLVCLMRPSFGMTSLCPALFLLLSPLSLLWQWLLPFRQVDRCL